MVALKHTHPPHNRMALQTRTRGAYLLPELFYDLFGGSSLGFIDNQGAHSILVLLLDCITFLRRRQRRVGNQ